MGHPNKNGTVCAVVVTYNRKKLLLECLEGLRRQTRTIDALYIIDNASIDGTPETLKEHGFIPELPPEDLREPWEKSYRIPDLQDGNQIPVCYVRMNENTGGAGGFHEGVKRSYNRGYDWIWLMDDDVEPIEAGLETMLQYSDISKCIHPAKAFNERKICWGGKLNTWIALTRKNQINNYDINGKEGVQIVTTGCFEGMLIHRDIVAIIGFPDPRFFLVRDDGTYGFLASFYTLNVVIKKICFFGKINNMKSSSLVSFGMNPEKRYYWLRNYLLVSRYICDRTSYGHVKRLLHHLIFILLFIYSLSEAIFCHRSKKAFDIIIRSFRDGLRHRWGRLRI